MVYEPNLQLQSAITNTGFSFQCIADLGFFGWNPSSSQQQLPSRNITKATRGRNTQQQPPHLPPPPQRYYYKTLSKATVEDFQAGIDSTACPDSIIADIQSLKLPMEFQINLRRQVVACKFPYGQIGMAALYHAKDRCDLQSMDFFFGCSTLDILSAEKVTNNKSRSHSAPYLVMKVPGTKMIMIHYQLNFGQDYTVPGFQFERLMTGKRLDSIHNVGFTEHVQVMSIGGFKVLMTAETDALDQKSGHPVEIKLIKQGLGGAKVFFQMIGSGSLTLYRGRNIKGSLVSVDSIPLNDLGQSVKSNHDVVSLEQKLIRNMERLKDWDRQGYFNDGKVYRLDFSPNLELHLVSQRNPLLPRDGVVKELLDVSG